MSLNPKRFHRGWLYTEHDPDGPPPDRGVRWKVLRLVVLVAFLVLLGRLWHLQVGQGERLSQAAVANTIRRLPLEAPRGVFYDRKGVQLTANAPLWNISLTRADMPKNKSLYADALARLESRLGLGAVVALNAHCRGRSPCLPLLESRRSGLVDRLSRLLGLDRSTVEAVIAQSEATDSAVLLKENIPANELELLRSGLGSSPGVLVMLELQWLVEHGGVSPFRPTVVAENVSRELALAIEGERILIPGVSIEQAGARSYPDGSIFSAILGYMGKMGAEQVEPLQAQARSMKQPPYRLDESVGKAGLEGVLERFLRGTRGMQEVEVTSTNRVVRQGRLVEPAPGHNVWLTVDASLQKTADGALSQALRESGATSGALVALDPRSGQVLSLVSLPSYDSNLFTGGISESDFRKLQATPGDPMFNKAVGGIYTPGSALKPFTAAAGLAERVIDRVIKYRCLGGLKLASTTGSLRTIEFRDSNPRRLGPQNVIEALGNNCDIYFHIMAGPHQVDRFGRPAGYLLPGDEGATPFHGVGIDKLNRFWSNFGLGKRTGIDLPGEADGLLASREWKQQAIGAPWTLADTLNTAVGKGYTQVTPLQMAAATGAIANGGALYKPQLVLRVTDSNGINTLVPVPEGTGHAGMTPDHLATVREGMLWNATRGNTAALRRRGLLPSDVEVATMTGTPVGALPSGGAPAPLWFTAFAPYDRPEVALAVVVSGPRPGRDYAGEVAAKVLKHYFEEGRRR